MSSETRFVNIYLELRSHYVGIPHLRGLWHSMLQLNLMGYTTPKRPCFITDHCRLDPVPVWFLWQTSMQKSCLNVTFAPLNPTTWRIARS